MTRVRVVRNPYVTFDFAGVSEAENRGEHLTYPWLVKDTAGIAHPLSDNEIEVIPEPEPEPESELDECCDCTFPDSDDGVWFAPNPFAREYRQLRKALEQLIEVSDEYTDDPELSKAIGFARGTLALVQPVDGSGLD